MNRMKYIFLSLFAGFLCTSCADMLDVKDLSSMSETFVWEDAALAKQFLNELYADRPGYEASNNPFLNNITDEGRNGHAKTGADDVLRGAWTSSTSLGNLYIALHSPRHSHRCQPQQQSRRLRACAS